MTQIPIKTLQNLCHQAFKNIGLRDQDSIIATNHFITNELSGRASHGIIRVTQSIKFLKKGQIPQTDPEITNDTGSIVHMDAKGQLGTVAGHHATQTAIQRAKEHGIAMVGTRNFATSAGSMHYYLNGIIKNNLIAIAFCNSVAMVAPPDGRERVVGTNPFGIGIPGTEEDGMIADFSTAAIAYGKIMVMEDKGQDIPNGLLVDTQGNPSTNPRDAFDGAIMPLAGHQGFALATMIELLAGPLIGAKASKTNNFDNDGLAIITIDPAKAGMHNFTAQASETLNKIRQSQTQTGKDTITIPGDRSAQSILRAKQKGAIEVADKTINDLKILATSEEPT